MNPWDKTRLDKLRALAAEGKTAQQIGRHFDRTGGAIRKACRAYKIDLQWAKNRDWTDGQVLLLKRLAREGVSRRKIANALGKQMNAIESKAKRLGVKLPRTHVPAPKPKPRPKQKYMRRKCLCGEHMFDARVDENGRFLEFSCREHYAARNREARGAMI